MIILATGFNLTENFPFPTNMKVTIDGEKYIPKQHFVYNSCMISKVPNMIFVMGYFRFSWTLKADLVAQHLVNILKHLKKLTRSFRSKTPIQHQKEENDPFMLKSGYVNRIRDKLPKKVMVCGTNQISQ